MLRVRLKRGPLQEMTAYDQAAQERQERNARREQRAAQFATDRTARLANASLAEFNKFFTQKADNTDGKTLAHGAR